MSPAKSASETCVPNQPGAAYWYAFLSGQDGRVIRDFGHSEASRREPVSSALLLDRMEPGQWADFAASVQASGAIMGFETRISRGPSTGRLVLNGCQTPCGLLVFAILTPDRPAGDPDPEAGNSAVTEPMTRDELIRRANDAAAACDAMRKHQEDTSRLLRDAIHRLKDPISSIISSCEYLEEYAQDNLEPEQREMIAAIAVSAQTMLELSTGLGTLCGHIGPPTNRSITEAR